MTVEIAPAITMIVPTRNRTHTLRLVAPTYLAQPMVTEVIFVDDGGSDDLGPLVSDLSYSYPSVRIVVLRNEQSVGASQSRNIGIAAATNPYVLFCDDDEYLESDYAATCLKKLIDKKAGAVSGRRVYMREGETPEAALARFGEGSRHHRPFDPLLCELIAGARFSGDIVVPFTNTIIVTSTELARTFCFDRRYFEGNAYREESDYQMNLHVNGYDIIITGDVHSIHLPSSQIRKPGTPSRKRSRSSEVYWSVKHTRYFYQKYWDRYASRNGIRISKRIALGWFAVFVTYRVYLRPFLLSSVIRLSQLAKPLVR